MATVLGKSRIHLVNSIEIYAPLKEFIYTQQTSLPVYSYPVVYKLARAIDEYRGEHVRVHVFFLFLFIVVECIDDSWLVCVATIRVIVVLVRKPR